MYDPKFRLNHIDAITLKHSTDPICLKESHKTIFVDSVLSLTRAHGPYELTVLVHVSSVNDVAEK